jgi:TolA-binding protein
MTFKSRLWYPVAIVLTLVNVGGIFFAAGETEPFHAAVHGALALAFGLWAQRLRERRREVVEDPDSQLLIDDMRQEIEDLRGGMVELQERLDFTERMLSQARNMERLEERERRPEDLG